MNERGKSDRSIRPRKSANKGRGAPGPAERMEERDLAKGNSNQQTRDRAQSRVTLQHALDRVRRAARRDRGLRFTTLWHHVYDVDRLREAYFSLKRDSAAGIDGETWQHYGEALEENLRVLSNRLKRGAYRAKPVRRVYIPESDGRQRPIGVPVLEDKIVQRATSEVLQSIYETEFRGFSYGFRPGRSQHDALDACGWRKLERVEIIGVFCRACLSRIVAMQPPEAVRVLHNGRPTGSCSGRRYRVSFLWRRREVSDPPGRHARDLRCSRS